MFYLFGAWFSKKINGMAISRRNTASSLRKKVDLMFLAIARW